MVKRHMEFASGEFVFTLDILWQRDSHGRRMTVVVIDRKRVGEDAGDTGTSFSREDVPPELIEELRLCLSHP